MFNEHIERALALFMAQFRKQKDRYPALKSPEGSIEQTFSRDSGSDKGADKNFDKILDKTTNTFATRDIALFNMTTASRQQEVARPADATRPAEVARPVENNRSNDTAALAAAAARAEAQSRAEANRAEAVRRSDAMRTEAMRTEAARTEAQRRSDAVRTQTARSDAMRAEAQRRAEQNRAEALRNDTMRAEAQRRAEAERAEATRRAEAKKPSALAAGKKLDGADKTPGAVGALAFLGLAVATKELQALKQSDPEKYGKMTLEQVRQHKLSEEVGSRDKMSFMGLAMCNPFFLMALGATFAVMDDIKACREAKQKANGVNAGDAVNGQAGGMRRAVKGESIEETKAKQTELRPKSLSPEGAKLLGLDKKNKANPADSGDSSYLKFGLKKSNDSTKEQKPSSRAESEKGKQKLFNSAESSWEERAAARSLKNWIQTDKLIKKKQALGDQMERINGRAQFSEVASLAAKIQLIEKALKRQAQ